jgi:DNA-binding NtrC family response regulator
VWPTLADMNALAPNLKDFLDILEERLISEAMGQADGVKNQAAELLGIKRTTLIEKIKKKTP